MNPKRKRNIKKYYTKFLKDVYSHILSKEANTKFLSSIAKKISKEIGVTTSQSTISFLNFFKIMELMEYTIKFKIEITNLDNQTTEYEITVDGIKTTDKGETNDNEKL